MTYGTLPPKRYPTLSKLLHWLVAISVLITLPVAITMTRIADGPLKDNLFFLHKSLGILILSLMLLRVVNRFVVGAPAPEPDIADWQKTVSSVVHLLLYILLLAMPVVAWIGMSYAGMPAPFFGLFELPPLPFTKNQQLSEQIFAVHRWVGYLLALIAAVHIAAALYHLLILKDYVAQRMLPRALGGN